VAAGDGVMTGKPDPTPADGAGTGDGVMSGNKRPTFRLAATARRASGRATPGSVPPGTGGRVFNGVSRPPNLVPISPPGKEEGGPAE